MCWKRLTHGAITDVITVNTLIKECYTTITSQRAVPALHLRWRQGFIVLDVDPTPVLSVFLSRVNVLNCESRKKNPIVISHYPVWNSSPSGVGLLSRHGRNHSVSRILKTLVHRRCEFSMPISDQSAHKFSIKTNCAHPKKSHVWKGEHMSLMCDALIETRQQRRIAPFWRLGGFQRWKEIPEQCSEHQISFERKIKLAPHTSLICMASFPIGIIVFPTCNGPAGQRFTLVLGATRAILDPSSLASSHMAGLGKHLGIFVSPSR